MMMMNKEIQQIIKLKNKRNIPNSNKMVDIIMAAVMTQHIKMLSAICNHLSFSRLLTCVSNIFLT